MPKSDVQLAVQRVQQRAYYPTRRDHQLAYWQQWADRPGNRERLAQYAREYRAQAQLDNTHRIEREREARTAAAAAATVKRAPWSAEDDATVVRRDLTLVEIALMLGRTYDAVKHRRQTLTRLTRIIEEKA